MSGSHSRMLRNRRKKQATRKRLAKLAKREKKLNKRNAMTAGAGATAPPA
jgi:hypothetical protein